MFTNSYSLSKAYAFVLVLVLLSTGIYAQNVGIGTALPNTGLDVVRDLALREAAAVTINASNQIDPSTGSHVRITNTGTINEILNPQNGKVLYLINASGGTIVLANNAVATANKLFTGSGADYSLPNGATAHLIYNATNQAWQLAGVSPGATSTNNAWLLLGNSGTNPAVNFVGTTDCNSLRFRVNNQFSGLIECTANDGNTAFGYNTMANPTAVGALRNVAIGDGVLGALNPSISLEGDDNTGIGYRALASNTTGYWNTAIGSSALYFNTTGLANTATGLNALYSNTTGLGNTATGAAALYSNTSGGLNVATGLNALYSNTTGYGNVATGYGALFSNTTSDYNVATGHQALLYNTTGFSNVATGSLAMYSNTTGFSNVAAGRNALFHNNAGWQNTALGDSSGVTNTTGTGNTYLGYRADANANNYTNSTAIGANARVDASNAMVLGSITGVNGATANTNVGIGTTIPNTALDIARDLALREAATAVTITANQINSGTSSHLRITNTGTINEILNPQNGKVLYLINASGGTIVLANNAVATADKLFTGSGANYSLPNGATAHLIYNPTPAPGAWRLAGVSPGAAAASAGWLLTGNAGTNPAVNFLGTTDCQSLRFRVNNQFSGLIECAANDGNTAFGYNTMANPTAIGALRNVAIGDGVLGALNPVNPLEGDENTGIGYRALASNTTGYNNTATGAQALYSNTTGNYNVATGRNALYSNTTGNYNVATGYQALYYNTTGNNNTATGRAALHYNTTGFSNTATGYLALYSNTTGNNNTSTGYLTLYSNTTGFSNVATGFSALSSNTTGYNNTATGYGALFSNTTGNYNVATGYQALNNNTTGNYNVATGYQALNFNTTGFSNVAAGRNALYRTNSGWQNTAVGDSAGYTNASGTGNTYLGYRADAGANNYTNSTAIGANAIVRGSNSMMFGNNAVTNWSFGRTTAPTTGRALEVGTAATNGNGAYLTTGGVWTDISDRNLKTNITNLSGAEILAKIGQLPITRWTYKGTNETHIGPMAQDFYRLFNVGLDSVSISTVDPSGVALIGIQELKRQVESLQSENSALKSENSAFKKEIVNLNKEVANLRHENNAQQAAIAKMKDLEAAIKLLQDRAGIKAEK